MKKLFAIAVVLLVISVLLVAVEVDPLALPRMVVPLFAVLLVGDYVRGRTAERAAAHAVAGNLNLLAQTQAFSEHIEGRVDGVMLRYHTDTKNAVGKGACLELELPTKVAPNVVVGPKHLGRLLRREASRIGATVELELHDALIAYTDHVALPLMHTSNVRDAITALTVPDLDANKPGAVIVGPRIISARHERFRKPHQLRRFLNEGLQVATLLSGRRA